MLRMSIDGREVDAATFIAATALLAVLPALLRTELRERRIPDAIPAALLVAALLAQTVSPAGPQAVLVAAAAGLLVPLVARRITRGGLGWGDVKLSAATCLLVGAWRGLAALLAASLLALGCIGLGRLEERASRGSPHAFEAGVPFGPFIVAGALVVLARVPGGGGW